MLKSTFIHIPGVGLSTERKLWARGICTWQDAAEAIATQRTCLGSVGPKLQTYLPKTIGALDRRDAGFFERLSRFGESWRLYHEFAAESVYIDIETTGLSPSYDDITVVGTFNGREYKAFVAGHNLKDLSRELGKYAVAVTFNGSGFDMRFLRRHFSSSIPPVHIDLRWTTYKLGYRGGLKEIEPRFGQRRSTRLANLDGFDAIILWNRHCQGDRDALKLLIEYNQADVVNLRPIMDECFNRLADQQAQFFPAPRRHVAVVR